MPGTTIAAAAQLTSTDDVPKNLATARDLAARAGDRGAALLVLPECFAFIGRSLAERVAVAEVLDEAGPGPILEALLEMARAHRMWVVGGGMPEVVPGEGKRAYNTAVVVSPEGRLAARYRKIHLFDIDIPGLATFQESAATAPGEGAVAVDTPLGRVGLSICYDLRFPELYRELALDLGSQVLVVPAAFTAHTGAAHWHTLLRARAVENQCYVIAAAQAGRHNEKRESYGHTLIYDPWGELLDEVAEGVGLAVAEIDGGRVEETRRRMPCHQHRVIGR
jgi:deaminated glutathione amidase